MKLGLVFSVFCAVLVTGAGCGGGSDTKDTSSGGSSSGGSGNGTSSGGSGASGGVAGSIASGGAAGNASGGVGADSGGGTAGSSSAGTAGSSGGDPLAKCKAEAASNPDPACANCACDHCLDALAACQADPTCVALRNCVQAKNCGCNDQLCVLTKCGNELTAAGGLGGPGTTKAIAVRDCTDTNACNCCN